MSDSATKDESVSCLDTLEELTCNMNRDGYDTGHILHWEWKGWGKEFRRIDHCLICGLRLDV